MTSQPPPKPPIVSYRTPDPSDNPNRPGLFFRRMMSGIGMGFVALVAGWILGSTVGTNLQPPLPMILGLSPIALLGIVSVWIDLRQRRYGYATGVIIAPFLIVTCIGALLLAICGGYARF